MQTKTNRFDELALDWDVAPMHIARTTDVAAAIRAILPSNTCRALEVGAGTGLLSFALAEDLGSVLASDPSEGMVAALQDKIHQSGIGNLSALRCGDDLAGADGPFDLVMLQMALHHIPDVEGFLGRARDRIVPGGILAIADLDSEDGSFHGPDVTDVHLGFDRDALAARLGTTGFVDIEFRTVHTMRKPSPGGPRDYPIFLAKARSA